MSDGIPRLLADNFEKCDQCGEIVLIHGRGECLELDDAVYCPRHARGRIDDGDWEGRWGNAMGLLETIRNDPTKAIKYHLANGIGDWWIVHREDHIYEKWSRCDDDESNFTTTSESSVVRDIERRALVGSYVGYAPHVVDIDDEPINATVESKRKVMTDGGTPQSSGDRTPRWPFAGWTCPCGSPQLDPDRLYCYTCLEAMAIRMGEELEGQHNSETVEAAL